MSNEKKTVLFTFAFQFLFHFYALAFPALAITLIISLNMDLKDVLKLMFPMYLAYGLFSLPWGFFADRVGNRTDLIICFWGTGIEAGAVAICFLSCLCFFCIRHTVH